MHPATIPLNIVQGATLRDTLRIMQPRFEYRTITAIASTAPVRLTADHDLPANWLAWVQGVTGMQELNRAPRRELPHRVEVVDADTLEINTLSAIGLTPRGGQLIYQPPVDLTGSSVVARLLDASGAELLQIPATITGMGMVQLELTDEQTSAITGKAETWTLDVITHGDVYRALTGPATVWPAGSLPSCASNGWVTVGGEQGPVGAPGRSVVGVEVDADGYLVVTLDDGTTVISAAPVNRPWGTIAGDIENQTDLMELLGDLEDSIPTAPEDIGAVADDDPRLTDARTPTGSAGGVLSGSYPNPGFAVDMATQQELEDGLATRIPTTSRGAANGVASLGADGKILESELPAIAITDTFSVASQAAMLALTAERGDIAIRTDLNKTFALAAEPASTLANWLELRTPTDAVLSVAGKTGAVTLAKGDVGLGNVDNTSDATKSIGGNAATATLAADSSKLGGQLPAYYATAAQIGDIDAALDLINGEVI